MLTRTLLLPLLVAATSIPGARAEPADVGQALLVVGPVIAGSSVVWGVQSDAGIRLERWNDGDRDVIFRSSSSSFLGALTASPRLVAFARSFPGCAPTPGFVCPNEHDILAGPLRGPLRRLAPKSACFTGTDTGAGLDASGTAVAYIGADCAHQRLRFVVSDRAPRGAAAVVHETLSNGCCPAIRIAGRYVAWSAADGRSVTVYDRSSRRVAYRADVTSARGIGISLGFDLQADGTLVTAHRLVEVANAGPTTVAWYSRAEPRPHPLPLRGADTDVRVDRGLIALRRYLGPGVSELDVVTPAGRVTRVAEFSGQVHAAGALDFALGRLAWATDRIASSRVDCPPPGQGRPCLLRQTGVTTLWLARPGTRARVVMRLPFTDRIAR